MSCCPAPPEISVGGSGEDDQISPSMEMGKGESAECYTQRAGNATGRQDDKTDPVADKIENTDIPLVNGTDVNVKFRLTPNSTKTATSWTYTSEPALPSGVTFTNGVLKGSFPKEVYGKAFKLVVTAEPGIDTRSFTFSPAKATGSNSISFIHPLPGAHVTSKFGPRVAPRVGASTMHGGVDFSLKPQPPGEVLAAANGTVLFSKSMSGYGNLIILQHFNASGQPLCTTYYAHLAKVNVADGQVVVAGQKIGKEGNTGVGTGPHLHFECRLPNGKKIDPLPLIKGSVAVATSVDINNQADLSTMETQNNNGALTPENVNAKESACEPFGPSYPAPKVGNDPVPVAPPGDPFEKAWFFTMFHEVGPHWTINAPNDPEVAAGKIDTDAQRKKVGLVTTAGFPGGVTKFGIAQKPNPDLKVLLIDYATAKQRGYNGYWKAAPSALAATKPKTAVMMFDICFLHGPGNGKKMAQAAKIDTLDDNAAFIALSKAQRQFISSLPNSDRYTGWFTRNSDLLEYVKGIA
jgi:murein DD-endopeptidase MepM/ murein hydrolase activator NlpD